MKVQHAMTPYPTSCSPDDSINRIGELMWDFDISVLPVVDRDGHVVGVVTSRDIRAARESSLTHRSVSSVMSSGARSRPPSGFVASTDSAAP